MRFDVNAFFGHWPYWPLPHTGGEDVLRLMDRFDIDRAAITSLRGLHGDGHEANTETLALVNAHPDRFVPVACTSPMQGGGARTVRQLAEAGFRAVRLYPQLLQGYTLGSAFAHEVAAAAGEHGITVIVPTRPMMNFRFPTLPIDHVTDLARRHPRTRVVLSGPNYLSEFRTATEAMQQCANIRIEISCVQGFQAVARLVDAVGAQRVLFGTGLPLHYPACNTAKLEHAEISDEQREAISASNAVDLFDLTA